MNSETMRVITQQTLGGPEVLTLDTAPIPTLDPSEVLVRVEASSLSPTDWVHRRIVGFLGDGAKVLGWDVAGTVVTTGLGVTVHAVGDRVFGMLPYPYGHGAAAEFVVAPARALVPVPGNIAMREAGVVPLAGLTAWQALIDTAGVKKGDRVLIHAAAGGVGHLAVQIARARGAYVIGTASRRNREMVRRLGAHEVIDYKTTDFRDVVSELDIVLDAVGGDTAERSLAVVRRGGAIVSLVLNSTTPLGPLADAAGVAHHLMLVEHDRQAMQNLASLLAADALEPVIDLEVDLFDIDAVRAAHAYGDTGHVAGKIALLAR